MTDARPDPAELLARAQREESAAGRGKLKIFLGMAPGVGKTYAMLAAAQRLAREGVDVVAGIVETHGRTETEQLLLGLDVLPRRKIDYRGASPTTSTSSTAPTVTLEEFDLDAALARRPDLLLIDELAHTNAPGGGGGQGGRFEKRWQDVQECLKAGLNVATTLNIQHLESLTDVVAQITGVSVKETVPDSVLDEADEIELVDLAPEVLLERLKAGRVYLPENAARAVDPSDGFFRKGNLAALRELALRRTAAWVDAQMRRYKSDRGIRAVWPAGDRILVAVSPSPLSGKLVRAAKRMAAGLHADLLAVYVESPRTAQLPPDQRERLTQTLRLAESLGAETATLTAPNAARELIAFARSRNVGRIVVGKTGQSRLRDALLGSFVNNLIRESGDIDIYVIRGDDASDTPRGAAARRPAGPAADALLKHGLALAVVGVTSALAALLFGRLDVANISMLYLAGVVIAAVWLGRGPAVLAALAGVAAFDFFFVSPRFSFAVADAQYAVTFLVMLAVGLLIAQLTTRLRQLAADARERERRTAALYALSRRLAAAESLADVASVAVKHLHETFASDAILAVPAGAPDQLDPLAFAGDPDWFDAREQGVARWALDHNAPAGLGTSTLPGAAARSLPLSAASGKLGVLSLRPADPANLLAPAPLLLLDAFAGQIASALERVTLSKGQQTARLEAERERLRNALLSSVSHDLRTPLASIAGAASTLDQSGDALDQATRRSLTRGIVQESSRLNDLIANLVFATRLEAGAVALSREWTTVEELVGVGLARLRDELAARPFRTHLPANLPLVRVDNAMLPQVIHNLAENALRYTPPGTPLSISAWATDTHVVVSVADEGPGLAEDEASKVFQRFYRGRAARAGAAPDHPDHPAHTSRAGMGLGLTIAEGVIKAHDGRIWAERNTPRGVAFKFALPIERPQPAAPPEAAP